jgi:hypothetical protein
MEIDNLPVSAFSWEVATNWQSIRLRIAPKAEIRAKEDRGITGKKCINKYFHLLFDALLSVGTLADIAKP